MTTTWYRTQGDVADTIVAQLMSGATAQDLTGVTAVEAHVWPQRGGTTVTLTAAVTDATNGKVTVQLSGSSSWLNTAVAGPYWIEYQTTWSGGAVLTWPEGPRDQIIVEAQGA